MRSSGNWQARTDGRLTEAVHGRSSLCGIEIEWIEDGKLPEHFVLVGALLKVDAVKGMELS